MIKLKDPGIIEAGSTVCITATNVNAGAQFLGNSGKGKLKLTVTLDFVKHTAKICFVAPSSSGMIRIYGADGSSPDTAILSIYVRR